MTHLPPRQCRPISFGLLLTLLFLATPPHSFAQSTPSEPGRPLTAFTEGLLQSVGNARVVALGNDLRFTRDHPDRPIELSFTTCQGLGIDRKEDQWWVLPLSTGTPQISANKFLWVLPLDASANDHSWQIELHGGDNAIATKTEAGLNVVLNAHTVTLHRFEARPHSDAFGNTFTLDLPGGPALADALAGFYWGTMLPSVVERTMAAGFPYSSGYVLSTLKTGAYAGSYPAVDHEFQIKGRLAFGSQLDLDVVKRMIGLQIKLMADDPERLSRAPTSVQPDGRREYHIRRNSMDRRQNAAMFPLTGNIEIQEEAWHLYEATKDRRWLATNIPHLEAAAAWTEGSIDQYGRVWSDVFYEDQVIKDGRVTQAQAFAARSFNLLSHMEAALGRSSQASRFAALSRQLAAALIQPLPTGFWDERKERFVDWVDRDGVVHDHVHLLANTLPVTFGYATPAQAAAVARLVSDNAAEFERFPSFLSAHIADYTPSEIGDGGPYDLSAAGRYWYWDAAYREATGANSVLLSQLEAVAAEAKKNNDFMGERYDMDHVFYIDGKNAHGAEQYYEYPNVFSAVLISKFLGLTVPADADLAVAPHLTGIGTVDFKIPEYSVHYAVTADSFVLTNLADHARRFRVDLSALDRGPLRYRRPPLPAAAFATRYAAISPATMDIVTLPAHGSATWTAQPLLPTPTLSSRPKWRDPLP